MIEPTSPSPAGHARALLLAAFAVTVPIEGVAQQFEAFDQFQFYFGSGTTDAGLLTGATADADGNFWAIGTGGSQRIRFIEYDGANWGGTDYIIGEELNLFHRADDLAAGNANSGGGWGTQFGGSANGFLLNPAPLDIEVPTGSGGTQVVNYPAGTLAFISDAVAAVTEPDGTQRPDATKKLFRYDLRKTFLPTSALPDYNTARFVTGGPPQGQFGVAEWNDVFQPLLSEQDLQVEAGFQANDSFLRQFAWSSDGQSIYAIDSSPNLGGIYRVDATRWANDPTGVQRVRVDNGQIGVDGGYAINSEPTVVAKSVFDLTPGLAGSGDQIVVEGTFDGGNRGGINVYLDTGVDTLSEPQVLFTEQDFRAFADYLGPSTPRYNSITSDDEGNLYVSEQITRMLFKYDTQGRFSKLFSERELDNFQEDVANGNNNDVVKNLTVRSSTNPGFEVVEVLYTDKEVSAPVGVLSFLPGDFDRDNDLDADDLSEFAMRLQTRNTTVADEDVRFDLNGNREAFRSTDINGNPIITDVSNGEVVVDWGDVKVLQQFADIPNGDTNFDGALDFVDLDTMAANYFTIAGQTEETWVDGDFASIDPGYLFDAPDVNLVNEVDLGVIADAWLNDLGQPAPSEAELSARYAGQFLTDALAAFAAEPGLPGDYNADGTVDSQDYDVWVTDFGTVDPGADGNGDGVVDAADFTVWRDAFAATALPGDANGDGAVDLLDLDILGANFGTSGATLAQGDFNGDGTVDLLDLDILGSNFGAGASQTVPEPSALAVLACAVFAYRRR